MITKTPRELENELIGIICRLEEADLRMLSGLIDLAINPDKTKELKERIRVQTQTWQEEAIRIYPEEQAIDFHLEVKDITFFNNKIKKLKTRQEWMDYLSSKCADFGLVDLYYEIEKNVNLRPFEYKSFCRLVDSIFLKWIDEDRRIDLWCFHNQGWTHYYISKAGKYECFKDALHTKKIKYRRTWEEILESFEGYDKDGNSIAPRSWEKV